MTNKQLEDFNRAVSILYEREHGTPLSYLAKKYRITVQRAGQIALAARFNTKILAAVKMKRDQMNLWQDGPGAPFPAIEVR